MRFFVIFSLGGLLRRLDIVYVLKLNPHGIVFFIVIRVFVFLSIITFLVCFFVNTLHLFDFLIYWIKRCLWLRFALVIITFGSGGLIFIILVELWLVLFTTSVTFALIQRLVHLGNLCLFLRLVLV